MKSNLKSDWSSCSVSNLPSGTRIQLVKKVGCRWTVSSWEKAERLQLCRINHVHTDWPTNAASFYSWDKESDLPHHVCVCVCLLHCSSAGDKCTPGLSSRLLFVHVYWSAGRVPVGLISPVSRLIGSMEVETNYLFFFLWTSSINQFIMRESTVLHNGRGKVEVDLSSQRASQSTFIN